MKQREKATLRLAQMMDGMDIEEMAEMLDSFLDPAVEEDLAEAYDSVNEDCEEDED